MTSQWQTCKGFQSDLKDTGMPLLTEVVCIQCRRQLLYAVIGFSCISFMLFHFSVYAHWPKWQKLATGRRRSSDFKAKTRIIFYTMRKINNRFFLKSRLPTCKFLLICLFVSKWSLLLYCALVEVIDHTVNIVYTQACSHHSLFWISNLGWVFQSSMIPGMRAHL